MAAPARTSTSQPEPDEGDSWPWDMVNLYPRETGLPMTVWMGPGVGARHGPRLKVSMAHGDRLDLDNLAVVAIKPEPKLVHGELSRQDLALVSKWIQVNEAALLGHWEGRLGGIEFGHALKPI